MDCCDDVDLSHDSGSGDGVQLGPAELRGEFVIYDVDTLGFVRRAHGVRSLEKGGNDGESSWE